MAVYTQVSDIELQNFIAKFSIGDVLSCKAIAEGIENSNYLLETETGLYILTLFEKRVAPKDLPFFIGIMHHLAEKDYSCPHPVKDKSGKSLHELCGKFCCITTFLHGQWPRKQTSQHCYELGREMARFHLLGKDYPKVRENSMGMPHWQELWDKCQNFAEQYDVSLSDHVQKRLHFLQQNWPLDLPVGLIHADLFPDNVFFLKDKISGIIDFYFACTDYYAYDLAICLNCWCYDQEHNFQIEHAKSLLAGYHEIRPLTSAELKHLPLLTEGAALRFLLSRLYDWYTTPKDALVTPKDPMEYWIKLRQAPKILMREISPNGDC